MIKTRLKQSALLTSVLLSALFSTLTLAEVSVEDAYARAVPPGQMNSASFMTLTNSATDNVSLIAANSAIAKAVELHNHISEDGVMKMRQVKQINIPASGSVTLQPGGYHIMLIGLNKDLSEGQEIDLTLQFSDGSNQTLTLPVKKVMSGMKSHSHGHHHH